MPTIATITPEAKGNAYIIHMAGEIDISNLPDLEGAMKPLLDNKDIKAFILDCSELMFIDSKVVGYFAYLHTTLSHSERKLMIAAPNETVKDILTLVGLHTIVPHFATIDEAVNQLSSSSTQ